MYNCDPICIKAIVLNPNSIIRKTRRHNLNELLIKNKPDFVLLAETKLKDKHNVSFPNFDLFRNDRTNDNGGGTAVLCKNKYKSEQIFCGSVFSSFEYTMIKVLLDSSECIFIIAIYKPPDIQLIINELKVLINYCGQSKFIIGGDFNAKHRAWSNTTCEVNGNILHEWLNEPNTKSKIAMLTGNEPTCDRSENSYLDLVIFNKTLINNYSNTHHNQLKVIPYLSDHNAIEFTCVIASKISEKQIVCKYVYKNVDWEKINRKIETNLSECEIPINRNLSTIEIDTIATLLQHIICQTVEENIKKKPLNEHGYIDESQQTKTLKHNLKLLHRRKKRSRNQNVLGDINNSIKLLKIMITNSLKTDYQQFWQQTLKQIAVNPDVYSNIRRCSNYGKKNTTNNIMIDSTGKLYNTPNEKAKFLAEKFIKNHRVAENNADQNVDVVVMQNIETLGLGECVMNFNDEYPARVNSNDDRQIKKSTYKRNELFLSIEKANEIIKSRNNKKSLGLDNLNNFIIKKLSGKIWDIITILFNHIINTGHTPASWKSAIIIPIPKNNQNGNDIEQQRPISMLNPLSKILEKHMTKITQDYCDQKNIIPKHQYGFQKNTSTVHALINFQNVVVNCVNSGTPVQLIFLDIEKAFDTVWINGLVSKMISLGFDKSICRYILNFATKRKFAVKINEHISEYYDIPNGLPQGGVFSPTGWAIYIADFPKFTTQDTSSIIKISQYADDTALIGYNYHHDYEELERDFNAYLYGVNEYFHKWRIKLNKAKTERITCVGSHKATKQKDRNKAKNIKIKIEDQLIENNKQTKYLGLIITPNLEYFRHVDHVIKKVDCTYHKLNNIFRSKYIDKNVKFLAYKCLIRPIITYAAAIYFQTSSHQIERIRRKERKILRNCHGIYRGPDNKYINSKHLYVNIDRIDYYCVRLILNMFEKISVNRKDKPYSNWTHVLAQSEEAIDYVLNGFHKSPSNLWLLNELNLLLEPDGKLLFYNRKKNSSNLAYITTQ